jgi:hypothetical protein
MEPSAASGEPWTCVPCKMTTQSAFALLVRQRGLKRLLVGANLFQFGDGVHLIAAKARDLSFIISDLQRNESRSKDRFHDLLHNRLFEVAEPAA